MCDQDHFDDDLKEFEAGGLVTRRQFGVLVGAGIALMLPKVVNAVAVTESEVTVKTPAQAAAKWNGSTSTGQQTWVDSQGSYIDLQGGMQGDKMVLTTVPKPAGAGAAVTLSALSDLVLVDETATQRPPAPLTLGFLDPARYAAAAAG